MSAASGPDIIEDGLVLCLDAGNRESYPGSGTVWSSLGTSASGGTLLNGPTYIPINSTNTLNFDGTNDYVTCGPVLNFGGSTSVGTILVWAKGRGSFFSNQRPGVNNVQHGWISCSVGVNRMSLNIDAYNGPPYGEAFNAPLSATPYASLSGQWNFYSIRINRPIHQYTMGINDYFTRYTRNFTVTNYFNFNVIEVGRLNNSTYGTTYFEGQIAQVAAYNRVLTDQEVLQNYNATKSRFLL